MGSTYTFFMPPRGHAAHPHRHLSPKSPPRKELCAGAHGKLQVKAARRTMSRTDSPESPAMAMNIPIATLLSLGATAPRPDSRWPHS